MHKLLAGSLLAAASLLVAASALIAQERPAPQMEVFREIAEALANRDADAFLDQFDRQIPEYEKLRDEIRELLAVTQEIGTTMDVISDEGDEQKRRPAPAAQHACALGNSLEPTHRVTIGARLRP